MQAACGHWRGGACGFGLWAPLAGCQLACSPAAVRRMLMGRMAASCPVSACCNAIRAKHGACSARPAHLPARTTCRRRGCPPGAACAAAPAGTSCCSCPLSPRCGRAPAAPGRCGCLRRGARSQRGAWRQSPSAHQEVRAERAAAAAHVMSPRPQLPSGTDKLVYMTPTDEPQASCDEDVHGAGGLVV